MSQHLLSYGDCLLDPEDLKLLEHNEWLNDKVIDFAFEYFTNTIINKSQFRNDIILCCAEVIQLTKHSPDEFVEAILADLHLPSKQWIIMPINDNESLDECGGSHWSVLLYGKKEESFYHLDSLHHHNYQTACAVAAKISTLLKIPEEKQCVIKSTTPVQQNGYDCGMFVIKIAEVLVTGLTGGQCIPWETLNAIKPGAMHEYRRHLAGIIKDLAASNNELS